MNLDNLPTKPPCTVCGCIRVYHVVWGRLPREQRRQLRKDNAYNRAHSSGLCHRCAEAKRRQERDYPASSSEPWDRRDVVAEYQHLADPYKPLRNECLRLASRLGMSPRSMETALRRAGVRSTRGPGGYHAKAAA